MSSITWSTSTVTGFSGQIFSYPLPREEPVINWDSYHRFEIARCHICVKNVTNKTGNLRELCKKEHPNWFASRDAEEFHLMEYREWEIQKTEELEAEIEHRLCLVIKHGSSEKVLFAVCPRHLTDLLDELVEKAYKE